MNASANESDEEFARRLQVEENGGFTLYNYNNVGNQYQPTYNNRNGLAYDLARLVVRCYYMRLHSYK